MVGAKVENECDGGGASGRELRGREEEEGGRDASDWIM
jgi:hypothetical protein